MATPKKRGVTATSRFDPGAAHRMYGVRAAFGAYGRAKMRSDPTYCELLL